MSASQQSHRFRIRRLAGPVSTDDIIPAKYKHMYADPAALAPHLFENSLPGFAATLQAGDALVCDRIFGIGSSREQAVSALLAAGVACVIAPSFGRIFFRNAWNLGLLAVTAETAALREGAPVELDLAAGTIRTGEAELAFPPVPAEMRRILAAGGLLRFIQNHGGLDFVDTSV